MLYRSAAVYRVFFCTLVFAYVCTLDAKLEILVIIIVIDHLMFSVKVSASLAMYIFFGLFDKVTVAFTTLDSVFTGLL